MKKALTIAIIGTALAATVSFVIAGGARRESTIEADALPGYDIVDVPRYERGPLIIHVPQASYERGPRIIHFPQADDETATDRANVERDEPPRPPTTMWWKRPRRPSPRRVAPQPRSAPAPKPQRRSDAPPPPVVPPRTVLSAPPPPAEGPNPIRSTPRYNANADKFEPPRDPGRQCR